MGLYPSDASHILHSQILLQRSQTPLQPFPVRSNSFKQETCEEEPHTYLQIPKSLCTCCFCVTIVGVIMRQSDFVSVTLRIPAVSLLSQPLSLRQFPSFPAKLSSLPRSLRGGGNQSWCLTACTWESTCTLLYLISRLYQPSPLCGRKSCSDRSRLPAFDKSGSGRELDG